MKKALVLTLLAGLCLAQTRTPVYSLGTLTAGGTTIAANLTIAAHKHTLQVVVTGSPASCTIQLEGTLDDVTASPTWAVLGAAQTCTASLTYFVVDKPVTGIHANLTALTGGTNPTVTVKYLGVQ